MYIVPISSAITPIEAVEQMLNEKNPATDSTAAANPTFLDVFSGIINNAVDTNAQKNEDMVNLMLGNTDSLEQMQINLTKAEVATQLLVNVKNAVVDSYNEIVKMSI